MSTMQPNIDMFGHFGKIGYERTVLISSVCLTFLICRNPRKFLDVEDLTERQLTHAVYGNSATSANIEMERIPVFRSEPKSHFIL